MSLGAFSVAEQVEHKQFSAPVDFSAIEPANDFEIPFTATFATLGVIDHHGDVTLPGAFQNGTTVMVGAYQHDMTGLPIGKATLQADEQRAWVEGVLWTDTANGQDTYKVLKRAVDKIEWSYIFTVTQSDFGPFDTNKGIVDVRFLKALDVWSVDPVLRGAGIGTGTQSIKSFATGLSFADHSAGIAEAVEDFVARAKGRLDYRAKEGRQFSAANVDRLNSIAESLRSSADALDQMLADATPRKTHGKDLEREWFLFQQTLARANGVLLAN